MLAGRVRPRARRALVATHAIASAAWVGISVVVVAMSAVAMTTRHADTMRVTYELLETFDVTLMPWANFTATLSGLALGLVTPWGVLHYWVAIKLGSSLLITAVAFLHHSIVAADAERLGAAGGPAPDLGQLPAVVLFGFAFSMLNLIAAMILSLYKPGGRIRNSTAGRRTQPAPA